MKSLLLSHICGSITELRDEHFSLNPLSEEGNPAVESIYSWLKRKILMSGRWRGETYPGTAHTTADVSDENVLIILFERQRTATVALEIQNLFHHYIYEYVELGLFQDLVDTHHYHLSVVLQ